VPTPRLELVKQELRGGKERMERGQGGQEVPREMKYVDVSWLGDNGGKGVNHVEGSTPHEHTC